MFDFDLSLVSLTYDRPSPYTLLFSSFSSPPLAAALHSALRSVFSRSYRGFDLVAFYF